MGLLDAITGGISGISAIAGLLGADNARRQAMRQQQQAINDLHIANDRQYQNVLGQGAHSLYDMAGLGADAIHGLGRNLGADAAAGGVYNSSAVGGALALAARDQDAAIANLASRNYYNANALHGQQEQNIANMGYNLGGQNLGFAQNNFEQSQAGLGSFLGGLAQQNLQRSGANSYRTGLPAVNGTAGQGPNLPGNAGLMLGGIAGAFGSPGSVLESPVHTPPIAPQFGLNTPNVSPFRLGAANPSPFRLGAGRSSVLAGR